jgi:D-alanyl-lipoteichoic acid acyltransferase DltB (MBOAT superfamily)
MLFNSHVFLFAFLPITWLVFRLLASQSHTRLARGWLVVASLFFYGWWNPRYLPLILLSAAFNYVLARAMDGSQRAPVARKGLLLLALAGNLGALGYFKYAGFFADAASQAIGAGFELAPIVLPLAISFFTFQQIAYQVDVYRGQPAESDWLDYALFVTFFPQLIAGPIVHHREMLPQFERPSSYLFRRSDVEIGLTIFAIGLFKKVVLADGVALHATVVFENVARGGEPDLLTAWAAALAYTLQLYFDFSGYSDMAIGLGRLFGIRLPLNFDSPYRATSIIDFWRRWHMTLSRFLRDYLYIALGGNRRGPVRRYVNLMVTMLLGGLWHGAGWTFVVWGGLHGLYLLINHGFRALRGERGRAPGRVGTWLSRGLTFLAVVIGWVFFRADSLHSAVEVLAAMFGANGASWANADPAVWALLASLLTIVWWAPNTQTWMARYEPALTEGRGRSEGPAWLRWRPTRGWALAMAVVLVWGLLGINQYSEFLYFQF